MSIVFELWEKAKETLNSLILKYSMDYGKVKDEAESVDKKYDCAMDDLRNADREDRVYALEEVSKLRSRLKRYTEEVSEFEKFITSPYFSKIDCGEIFYISKYKSDLDNNVVLYTSPIAALRFGKVGQSKEILNIYRILKEKEFIRIENQILQELEHYDSLQCFIFDGEKIKLIEQAINKDIEVTKENAKKEREKIILNQDVVKRSYTLGEIIDRMRGEQDEIMRSPFDGVTLIKGAAGSGKTNIAFHRIAYLVNEFPEEFKKENIAVFCFNVALKKYLTNILYQLNISDVNVYSFDEWIYERVKSISNITRIDYINESVNEKRIKSRSTILNVIKSFLHNEHSIVLSNFIKDDFFLDFKNYLHNIEQKCTIFSVAECLKFKNYMIEEFNNKSKAINNVPTNYDEFIILLDQKINVIFYSRYCKVDDISKSNSKFKFDAFKILEKLKSLDIYKTHLNINFNQKIDEITQITSSDLYILGVVFNLLLGDKRNEYLCKYDHVVVDEVQDFSPIQLSLINSLHKNSMTIVGDVNQKIFENGVDSWEEFGISLARTYELCMCHRSTLETILFANEIIGNSNSDTKSKLVGKRGEKPCIISGSSWEDVLTKTASSIKKIKERDKGASVVVVYPKNKKLDEISKFFNETGIKAYVPKKNNWKFSGDVIVTGYYQIKGLEFDYIYMLGINDYENMTLPNKENVIYTVVTRAQKRVMILYENKIPRMLQKIDSELYNSF